MHRSGDEVFAIVPAKGASPMNEPAVRPLEPEDLAQVVEASAPVMHPTGRRVLYIEHARRDGAPASRIVALERDGGPKTWYEGAAHDLAYDAQGAHLAFLAPADDEVWLQRIDNPGEPPHTVARIRGSARRPVWAPDGRHLLLEILEPAPDPLAPRVVRRLRSDLNATGFLGDRCWGVSVVDAFTGELRRLGDRGWHHLHPAWSPDGREIALVTTRRPDWDLEWVFDVYVVDWEHDGWRRLTDSDGVALMPSWSRDGRHLTFFHNHADWTSSTRDYHLMHVRADAGEAPRCLTHELDRGAIQGMVPGARGAAAQELPDGRWLWLANLGGRPSWMATSLAGESLLVAQDVGIPSVTADGTEAATLGQFADRPAEVCRVDLRTGALRPLTDLNPWLGERQRPAPPRLLTWPSVDGPVEGWLWRPRGAKSPRPTLIQLHGGPHGAVGPYFNWTTALLTSHGFNVAAPNFRGSAGYGQAFADLIHADWGPKEGEDVAALIDRLTADGEAASGRIGVYGGSYGGFLTNWMVTHYPRAMQAAVTLSTISHLATLAYGDDHWESLTTDMEGVPWEIPAYYREHSPITLADRIEAPILILHGEDDGTCNPLEAEMLFVALRWQKKPVEWVRYPAESHGFLSGGRLATRIDAHARILAWFRHYLQDTRPGAEEGAGSDV